MPPERDGSYARPVTSAPSRTAVLAAAAVLLACALAMLTGAGVPEVVFGAVTLSALLLVLDHGYRSWRSARREYARAREISAVVPAEIARAASIAERTRLADDIAAGLRVSLTAIEADAHAARSSSDPSARIAAVGQAARGVTGELRRQLGLPRDQPVLDRQHAPAAGPAIVPTSTDLAIAAGVTVLAVIEAIVYPIAEGLDRPWLSVVLTAVSASAILARRAAPGLGATVVGLAYLAGLAFTAPVSGGFWSIATVGGLLGTIASRGSVRLDWWCAGFLLLTAGLCTWLLDPVNVGVLLVMMAVTLACGAWARWVRSRGATFRMDAEAHLEQIDRATRSALAAERTAFAREIHDIVSHAVGLIAVQAAAAEVSWPTRPGAARAALAVIEETATRALSELDRLPINGRTGPRTAADLEQLIERIRATGTTVRVEGLGRVPPGLLELAYRVVQESLTNVLRHTSGASAGVTVVRAPHELELTVTDDGDGPGPTAGRGYGLVGLAERVGLAGGSLRLGTNSRGGFEVRAILPLAEREVPA